MKGKTVKNRRVGTEKRDQESGDQGNELEKMKGRPGFRYKTRRDDNNRRYGA